MSAGCTGSWCQVSFNGEVGYCEPQLSGSWPAGLRRGRRVAAAPGYVYDERRSTTTTTTATLTARAVGFYASPSYRSPATAGAASTAGTATGSAPWQWPSRSWSGSRTGNWQGRHRHGTGGGRIGCRSGPNIGARPAAWARRGCSAPAGMRGGAARACGAEAPAGGAARWVGGNARWAVPNGRRCRRGRLLALTTLAEHALEDRVDVLEVIAEVEVLLDLGVAQLRASRPCRPSGR